LSYIKNKIRTGKRLKLGRETKDKEEVTDLAGERDTRKKEIHLSCVPDDFCNKRRLRKA
jgi:hypothetical protein